MGVKHELSAVRFGCVFRPRITGSRNKVARNWPVSAHDRYMDKQDLKILDLLQKDGSLPAAQIAERVALSKVPCWRRIQRMQEDGVIRKTVALLDAKSLNVGTTVFVMMRTAHHSAVWFERFQKAVRDIPEIIEIYRMSGEVDYLMRVVVPDIEAYDLVYKKLIALNRSAGRAARVCARNDQEHARRYRLHYARTFCSRPAIERLSSAERVPAERSSLRDPAPSKSYRSAPSRAAARARDTCAHSRGSLS